MTGRILEVYTRRNAMGNGAPDTSVGDQSDIDDLGCFGWLRGIRDRAFALELRRLNGYIVAVPYHAIERFEFDPSDGIALTVAGQKIRLKGRNLNGEVRPTIRLFEGLTRYRISWVQEGDGRLNASPSLSDTVIEAIEW